MQIVTVSGHQDITEDWASQLFQIFPKTSEDVCFSSAPCLIHAKNKKNIEA